MKLIYFHGFGSSAASGTIQTLRNKLTDFESYCTRHSCCYLCVPLPFLKGSGSKEQPNVIVGTSMGGMYAQQCLVINRI